MHDTITEHMCRLGYILVDHYHLLDYLTISRNEKPDVINHLTIV